MPVSGIWAAAETNQRQAKKPGNRKVGKRYHNAAKCKGPSGAATIKEIPLKQAIGRGKVPCPVCHPSILDN